MTAFFQVVLGTPQGSVLQLRQTTCRERFDVVKMKIIPRQLLTAIRVSAHARFSRIPDDPPLLRTEQPLAVCGFEQWTNQAPPDLFTFSPIDLAVNPLFYGLKVLPTEFVARFQLRNRSAPL